MIPRDRVLQKLDSLLQGNDTSGAKRLLEYWLAEAEYTKDESGKLLMLNELMGLCRKLGQKEQALKFADDALRQTEIMGIQQNIGAATTYLNSATVLKAFGNAEESLTLFEKARDIYERELSADDERLGGLYNNMGLTLVDLRRFCEAEKLYLKAIEVMKALPYKEPEQAVTFLNMASAAEAELGAERAEPEIAELINKAASCLDMGKDRSDGNYAFVCDKCASVFGYYGYEEYAAELKERSRRIYEGT